MRDREWLVSPAELGSEGYHFGRLSMDAVRRHESELDSNQVQQLRTGLEDQFGFNYDTLASLLVARSYFVATGDIQTADYEDYVRGQGFQFTSEHRGFRMFEGEGAIGVSGDAVVICPSYGPLSARQRAEKVIDAEAGRVDRYQDTDEDWTTLMSEVGQGLSVGGNPAIQPDLFDADATGLGLVHRFDGGNYRVRYVLLYEDAGSVDVQEPADLDQYYLRRDHLQGAEVTTDGRIVRVEGQVPADEAQFTAPVE